LELFVKQRQPISEGWQRAKGFTIIEVLIVLAIAGLIMVIVFMAVPALQRNSRNTRYRTEANQLLAAYAEFINTNSRTPPANGTSSAPFLTTAAAIDADKVGNLTKNKNITQLTIEAYNAAGQTAPTFTKATIAKVARCTGTGATTSGAPQQVAIIFAIEDSAGNVQAMCQDS
jgi:prepilin-type N-terminal cleavage/methylation domain-containing protein